MGRPVKLGIGQREGLGREREARPRAESSRRCAAAETEQAAEGAWGMSTVGFKQSKG